MHLRRETLIKPVLGAVFVFALTVSALFITSSPVGALSSSKKTLFQGASLSERAQAFDYVDALAKCFAHNDLHKGHDKVRSGDLFKGGDFTSYNEQVLRTIDADNSGKRGCGGQDNILAKKAVAYLGINVAELVCELGYERKNGSDGKPLPCVESVNTDFEKSVGGDFNKVRDLLHDAIGIRPNAIDTFTRAESILKTGRGKVSTGSMPWDQELGIKSCEGSSMITKPEFDAAVSGGRGNSVYQKKMANGNVFYFDIDLDPYGGQKKDNIDTSSVATAGINYSGGSFFDRGYACAYAEASYNHFFAQYELHLKDNPDAKEGTDLTKDPEEEIVAQEEEEIVTCLVDGIGWIICPVMNFMASIADGAYDFISGRFLETNTSVVSTDSNNAVYSAWQAMRSLANGLFVIAFIIIIYSQMTGAGISNYGVKRMLPRLVIAAVLVNVSFFICQLAVDLSNVLGYSIKNFFDGLAANATGGVQLDMGQDATGAGAPGFFGVIVAAVLVGGAIYYFLAALAPILLAAVVALIMILFILLARQALIILLIVIAPVAFVAYLLPNTQQWFDKWRKTFTALLLVFPIVGLVFGASKLASAVITANSNPASGVDQDMWAQVIGAGIAVLPLFIVPGILKKSLDGVGNIGARINSIGGKAQGAAKTRGANSRLSQLGRYGQHKRSLNRASSQAGRNRFRGGAANPGNWGSAINRGINKLGGEGFTDFTGDEKLVDGMVAELKKDPINTLGNAKSAYAEAAANGDTMRAQAALKVLGGMGAKGQEEISSVILAAEKEKGGINAGVASATRKVLASSSDPALQRYSFSSGTLASVQGNRETYAGLNPGKVAAMSPQSIARAMKAGGIDKSITDELLGSNSRHDINAAQRNALMGLAPEGTDEPGLAAGGGLPVPSATSDSGEVSVNVRGSGDGTGEQALSLNNPSRAADAESGAGTVPPENQPQPPQPGADNTNE